MGLLTGTLVSGEFTGWEKIILIFVEFMIGIMEGISNYKISFCMGSAFSATTIGSLKLFQYCYLNSYRFLLLLKQERKD